MRGPALVGIEQRSQHFTELCKNATGGVLDIYVSRPLTQHDLGYLGANIRHSSVSIGNTFMDDVSYDGHKLRD